MRHGYMYNGAFELNYSALRAGKTSYRSTEGGEQPLPPWPDEVNGVRVGYMEKTGKKFLGYKGPDEYIDAYSDFYDEVLEEEPVLVD